jgi:hypothetical protein
LHLRQVFARAASCVVFGNSSDDIDIVFGDVAVVTTSADIGGSGADVGWYLLKVKNTDLVNSRKFVGSLCISAQWPPSRFV